ncbi:MAG: hypothetical protein L0271_26035 [Gemmatimonadetes bacterium]|nr:hypothetical protein [Gemmatimonadota bacterium]
MERRIAALLIVTAGIACASGGGGPATGSRTNTNTITTEELDAASVNTVYDVIQQLRPQFLRTRPGSGSAVVYVDGARRGGTEELRRMDKSSVAEIRYVDGQEATMLYGTGHGGGAILVTSRR